MDEKLEMSAKQIAELTHGKLDGEGQIVVNKIVKLESNEVGGLTFANSPKYESFIYTSQADIILVYENFVPKQSVKPTLIRVKNPQLEIVRLLQYYDSLRPEKMGVSPRALIASTAKLGKNVYVGDGAVIGENVEVGDYAKIYPQVYLGDNVKVGTETILYAGVKIYEQCIVGADCILHAGCVIGADGFGFMPNEQGIYEKIPQLGNVIIEDNVEIGANSCIDRAMFGSTIIHKGCKIDNLNQIAHNCEIGENTVMAACCGISGSVRIGKNCIFAGQVGVKDHVVIGDRVVIGSQSGIHKNVKNDQTLLGTPAIDGKKMMKIYAAMNFLPQLVNKE